MTKIYKRENYLKKIRGFYNDEDIIKVITGVRRCGKSFLMLSVIEELKEKGIKSENIIHIDLDKRKYRGVKTPDELEKLIDSLSGNADGLKYLFIDEIQNVSDFEELINAYRNDGDYSIFITGSNSYLLSGELATKLTGRYIEFEIFTLTFEEYEDMKSFLGKPVNPNPTEEFDAYILEGGFPKSLDYDTLQDKRLYVKSVISEIFEKDIKGRVKIKNVSVFERIQTYVINNFGCTTSITNIIEDLAKEGICVKRETVNKYIKILEDAKIIYSCERFDLKSRRSLKREKKYYLADLSFYFTTNTDNRINYGPVLENIVFAYAKSRNYEVSVGRIGKLECDFILRDINLDYAYVQVAMTIMDNRKTEDREYRPLELIKDNYPKYVMTRNDMIQRRNGIKHINLIDFIKNGDKF